VSAPKPKVQFSIRIPEEVIKLLDEIAENTGLNITRNNVVEQAAEWYVRTYRANGNRALTNEDFTSLIEFIQGKGGAGAKTQRASASFDSSPSTATTKSSRKAG
jgi:metal-responsive CopG/Arc/MetJ family transcriptional regulator